MQSIIDTNILPNPFAPNVGDVYGRKAVAISDGAPLRVVVLDTGGIETHITVLADGREELVTSLPLYLASIPGIEPIGRVQYGSPKQDVAPPAGAVSDEDVDRLRENYAEYPNDIVSRLLDAASGADSPDLPSDLFREAAFIIDDLRNGRGG